METTLATILDKEREELELREPRKSDSRLVPTVRHIGASLDPETGEWKAHFYDSLRNQCYSASRRIRGTSLTEEEEDQREVYLKESLEQRAEHIIANRHYLNEQEGRDVGLLLAAAHWRYVHGDRFYTETADYYKENGVDFSFEGPERAIVVETADDKGEKQTYVIAARRDLMLEENACQIMEIEKWQTKRPELVEDIAQFSMGFRSALGHYEFNGYHILKMDPQKGSEN